MAGIILLRLALRRTGVTARGNEQRAIFRDEKDRARFTELLAARCGGYLVAVAAGQETGRPRAGSNA